MKRVLIITAALLVASCSGDSDETSSSSTTTGASTTVESSDAVETTDAPSTTDDDPTTTVAATTTTAAATSTTAVATTTTAAPTTTTPVTAAPTTAAPATTAAPTTTVAPYDDYVTITDESDLIEVDVPVQWNDIDGRPWDATFDDIDDTIGPAITASPDRQAYIDTWGTPGIFIGASAEIGLTVEELINELWFGESCDFDGQFDYDDGVYTGLIDEYSNCGPEGSTFYQLIAEPDDGAFLVSVQILAVSDADLLAADIALSTFLVSSLDG